MWGNKLMFKVMTVVGTRPEIIRLSSTIELLDKSLLHVLVHTGQNIDYQLNGVFFEGLGVRKPDYFLNANLETLGSSLSSIISQIEGPLLNEKPDAFLVLGDTNSAITAIMAKRMGIPVFHMEAGNRCFDERVPEETNRRLVDHISDYNLVYTEHARRNLIAEGIHPSKILLTGSPMKEVISTQQTQISELGTNPLSSLGLNEGEYFLASLHRQETVEVRDRLHGALSGLQLLSEEHQIPVIVSTHPRTKNKIRTSIANDYPGLVFHEPFGFHEYLVLQKYAKLVLSDSGTISEESSILGFRAVTLRDNIERPEAVDSGQIVTSGLTSQGIRNAANFVLNKSSGAAQQRIPDEYLVENFSERVVNFVLSKLLGDQNN